MKLSKTIALTLLAAPAAAQVEVEWTAPEVHVEGLPYHVQLELTVGPEGGSVPSWLFGPGAFTVDGKPLGERPKDAKVVLTPSSRMSADINLGNAIMVEKDFRLGFAQGSDEPVDVSSYGSVAEDVDFMSLPLEELGKHLVLLDTNRGPMLAEFWPEVAPNHVRNFLDLSHTGFYDGILFHRVMPGFMIQGGDPLTKDPDVDQRRWGTGSGPRTLESEFNERQHVRGVLSMARTNDPHSATSQFFVCHDRAAHLDNQYTAFGKLVTGFEALDKIATAPPAERTTRPLEPQRIERARVVLPRGN